MKAQDIRIQRWLGFSFLFLTLLLAGCATMDKPEPPEEPDFVKEAKSDPEPDEMPEQESLGQIQPEAAMEDKMPFESELFSLSIMQAQLQEALIPLADAAGLNLVFDRDVNLQAPVTVNFTDLPLRKALELILDSQGYYYEIDENILKVKAMDTRTFFLDYSLVSTEGSSDVSGDSFDISTSIEEDDIKIWERLEEVFEDEGQGQDGSNGNTLLSDAGQAHVNKMAGSVTVTDRPENLERIADYLDNLEQTLRRQVLIEARLVEVSLDKGHEYGINWSMIRDEINNWGFDIEAGLNSGVGDTFQVSGGYTGDNTTAEAILRALSSSGKVNVLSAPRVNVLNNQSAMINLTEQEPYLEWEIREVEEGVYEPVPTVTFADVGISLGITPQIGPDGITNLLVVPVVSELVGSKQFSFEGFETSVPVLKQKDAATMVRITDGGTLVMGGIIDETNENSEQRIPGLGRIPGVGRLFSNQQRSVDKSEMVIIVKATVVER